MLPFLKSVARAYAERYSDLSSFMFVFPSKRAGTFFNKYLIEELGDGSFILPEVLSISRLVEILSDRTADSRIDQLFTLYACYCDLLQKSGKIVPTFDSFYGWGETAISDFNEVDMAAVNPDEIFKNLKDLREISSNFLTEEQLEVMKKYFGYSPLSSSVDTFWKTTENDSKLKGKFIELWRILGPLYKSFHASLRERGLTTTGGQYRAAVKNIEENPDGILPEVRKIVFVGFNALSMSEVKIFVGLSKLRKFKSRAGEEPFTDFVWDGTGPVLDNPESTASEFLQRNRRNFPEPEWLEPYMRLSEADTLPDTLRIISSPSNVAQVKIVSEELENLHKRIGSEEFKEAKVAVVLPDENLLLPMLYSFPEGVGMVNLTMGYSLRMTSAISFIHLLRRLQTTSWGTGDETRYYGPDLRLMLAHPYCREVVGNTACNKIAEYLTTHHRNSMSLAELRKMSEEAALFLKPLKKDASPEEVIQCIDSALDMVEIALSVEVATELKKNLDSSHIEVCRRALMTLGEVIREYKITMSPSTLFMLADRLLGGEKIHFEGEPLSGLQVMGLLETRALDFDYIFILSVNEGVIPRRQRHRSFLPNSLRSGYGMPPANYQETIFSYYFYRMISRAKEVVMIYDGRNATYRTGDVSRYVLQLRHLYATDKLQREERSFRIYTNESEAPDIEKDDRVMEFLNAYTLQTKEGQKMLSASSLQDYLHCPVKFFLRKIAKIPEENDSNGFIDIMTQGSIVHAVLERCYVTEKESGKFLKKPKLITADYLDLLIGDRTKLMKMMHQEINRLHFRRHDNDLDAPITKDTEIVAGILVEQVRNVLRYDRTFTPFRIHGCEIKKETKIEVEGGDPLNAICIIDRVDEVVVDGESIVRVVDYKTGSAHLKADTFEDIFNGSRNAKHIFQLQFYANLMEGLLVADGTPIRTEIYEVERIMKQDARVPQISDADGAVHLVCSHKEIQKEFKSGLSEKLRELMNPSIPFTRCEPDGCLYCQFRTLCGR